MTDWHTAGDLLGKINAALDRHDVIERERNERRAALLRRFPNATHADIHGIQRSASATTTALRGEAP
jgi:hypothetical protein